MQDKSNRTRWEKVIIICILIISLVFLCISRGENGMLCFIVGCSVFAIGLLVVNWIDKKHRDE